MEHANPTEAGLFIRLSDISLPRWQENYADILKAYAESLAIRQQELQRITEFDHVQAFKKVKNWGKYGWVVMGRALADMEIYEVIDVPNGEAEADERMLTRLNENRLQTLISTLKDDIPGNDDIVEAIELFEQGRYKPCAMMLFALIDGTLIRNDRAHLDDEGNVIQRSSHHGIRLAAGEARSLLYTLSWIRNIEKAYWYFFAPADDFNPTKEKTINRNFIDHGMATKPVERISCIKLFILLSSVLEMVENYPLDTSEQDALGA